ncbi:hypothetical protein [Curtobacterium sp. SORGH_AS_0776]|uniref:hypothetical protein n=1 Tax=Curtobacterium sp. SORGH_AS_0776 TaxID=3041798 RepID=UPI002864A352|nr:hypothetical protein [Curtobacterium sp. SORGH_AS_0776]MDR6172628.1 single-stranded DNA-binding protein [Curtobacterium sp. SORGH_AS_0776]
MAKIEYTAFVEDWTQNNPQHPDWAMKTAEPHRKRDGDQWVTTARTFRTVKGGYANDQPVRIDFTQFRKGDRVIVTGTEVTEVREHDGKKYYDLVVKATSVRVADQNNRQQPVSAPNTAPQSQWDTQGGNGAHTGAQGSWATAGQIADAEVPW